MHHWTNFRKKRKFKKEKDTVIKLGKKGQKPELASDPEENYRREVLPPNVSKDEAQIQNLRQIYKKKTIESSVPSVSGQNSRGSSLPEKSTHSSGDPVTLIPDYDQDIYDDPPPVPPKNLSPEDLKQPSKLAMPPIGLRNSFSEKLLFSGKKATEFDEEKETVVSTEFDWSAKESLKTANVPTEKKYFIKRFSKTHRPISASHGENLHLAHEGDLSQRKQSQSVRAPSKPLAILYSSNGMPVSLLKRPESSHGSTSKPYVAVANVESNKQKENPYGKLSNIKPYRIKSHHTTNKSTTPKKLKGLFL